MLLKPDYSDPRNCICSFCNKEKAEKELEDFICLRHVSDHNYLTPVAFSYVELSVFVPRCKSCNSPSAGSRNFSIAKYLVITVFLLILVNTMNISFLESVLMFAFLSILCLIAAAYLEEFFCKILYVIDHSSHKRPIDQHPVVKLLKNHGWKEGSLRNKGVFSLHDDAKYFKQREFDKDIILIQNNYNYILEKEKICNLSHN